MRRFALLLPLACLAGCGGGSSTHVSAVGDAACAAAVVHGGTTYYGTRAQRPPARGARLGVGVYPSCRDSNAEPATPAQNVELFRIRGVDPSLAVLVARNRRDVYLAGGTFPQLPGHPLHSAFYASTRQPDERDSRCNRRRTLVLDAVANQPFFGAIPLRGRRDPIFVDARTRFRGEPRIRGGERLRIRVLECRHAGDAHYRKLIALSVEPS